MTSAARGLKPPFNIVHAMFDTHKYIKILKSQGVKENQAETIVQLVSESREQDLSKLATKEQVIAVEKTIIALEKSTKEQITALEKTTKAEIEGVKLQIAVLDKRMDKFEAEMKDFRMEMKDLRMEMKDLREELRTVLFWVIGTAIGVLGLAASVLAYVMPFLKH